MSSNKNKQANELYEQTIKDELKKAGLGDAKVIFIHPDELNKLKTVEQARAFLEEKAPEYLSKIDEKYGAERVDAFLKKNTNEEAGPAVWTANAENMIVVVGLTNENITKEGAITTMLGMANGLGISLDKIPGSDSDYVRATAIHEADHAIATLKGKYIDPTYVSMFGMDTATYQAERDADHSMFADNSEIGQVKIYARALQNFFVKEDTHNNAGIIKHPLYKIDEVDILQSKIVGGAMRELAEKALPAGTSVYELLHRNPQEFIDAVKKGIELYDKDLSESMLARINTTLEAIDYFVVPTTETLSKLEGHYVIEQDKKRYPGEVQVIFDKDGLSKSAMEKTFSDLKDKIESGEIKADEITIELPVGEGLSFTIDASTNPFEDGGELENTQKYIEFLQRVKENPDVFADGVKVLNTLEEAGVNSDTKVLVKNDSSLGGVLPAAQEQLELAKQNQHQQNELQVAVNNPAVNQPAV